MAKVKSVLKYDRDLYRVDVLRTIQPLTPKEIRQEYARLRSIAQKRLKRFEGTKWERLKIYQDNKNAFPKTRDLSDRDVIYALKDVSSFVEKSTSTISGNKEKMRKSLATLHLNGYEAINEDNWLDFVDYMSAVEEDNEAKQYASTQMAQLFETYYNKVEPDEIIKNFDKYLDEMQKAQEEAIRNKEKAKKKKEKSGEDTSSGNLSAWLYRRDT